MKVDITWRPIVEQTAITTSASSQSSSAFGNQSYCVRLGVATSASAYGVFFSIGSNPTATANSAYLPAGGVEYIAVHPGEKVAVLESAGALKVSITEMTH